MPQGPIATKAYGNAPGNVTRPVQVDALGNTIIIGEADPYVSCPGNATTVLGGNGTTGDVLRSLLLLPAIVNPGNVTIKDGTTAIQVYTALGNITTGVPITVSFGTNGIPSATGAWSVVAPVSVTVIAAGKFTA